MNFQPMRSLKSNAQAMPNLNALTVYQPRNPRDNGSVYLA
jgi:hypothetical protein